MYTLTPTFRGKHRNEKKK